MLPLKGLIEGLREDEESLTRFLSSFLCEKDPDIEHFLKEKAVVFEKATKSRTYLVIDEDAMASECLPSILGYFTLSLKTLHLPEETSNNRRRDLDGFSAKIRQRPISDLPCFLIGQFGRNQQVPKEVLTGERLMQYALEMVAVAQEVVGGRVVMLECRDIGKLIRIYQNLAFVEISREMEDEKVMIQMIRKIAE